jgi:hypothetical protein
MRGGITPTVRITKNIFPTAQISPAHKPTSHPPALSAAGLDRSKRLDLVHAAAALYGTAVLTTSEMRLLRHLELLRYQL